jgi:feruloyl esterase
MKSLPMSRERLGLTTVAAVAALLSACGAAAAANCADLTGKTFGDATIDNAADVTPPLTLAQKDAPGPAVVKAPFCRARGAIKPTADSDIKFEVWLPPASAWNGKFEGVGNGGFAGNLVYGSMGGALEAGYAVAATDTGHEGGSLDAAWALGHPEKIVDFGWRGIHETAVASKAIAAAYYGKAPARAYFSGCSDGGREALMEAQRFPKDYDGIVAGAPANAWTRLLTNAVWNEQALTAEPGSWLSPEKLDVVTHAALAACHGERGYIADPDACKFDPSTLLCKADQKEGCLTSPELAALRKIYSGAHDAAGRPISPGFVPGGEAGPTSWPLWITGSGPQRTAVTLGHGFAHGYFADMVFDNPEWTFRGQNLADALAAADAKTGPIVNSADPDLGPFFAAGGKLLQYHGWNDAAIPPQYSIDYSPTRRAVSRNCKPPIACSWRLAWNIAAAAPARTRSAASMARPRRAATPSTMSSPRSRIGWRTGRRRRGSSRVSITTATPPRTSWPSARGAPIPRAPAIPGRASRRTPRITRAQRREEQSALRSSGRRKLRLRRVARFGSVVGGLGVAPLRRSVRLSRTGDSQKFDPGGRQSIHRAIRQQTGNDA